MKSLKKIMAAALVLGITITGGQALAGNGHGPGNGTGNGGDRPGECTGDGPGTGECLNSATFNLDSGLLLVRGNGKRGNGSGGGTGNGGTGTGGGNGPGTGVCPTV